MTFSKRLALTLALSTGLVGIWSAADAQTAPRPRPSSDATNDDSKGRLGTKAMSPEELSTLGIPLGNGMFMVPTLTSEVGHDSNPDNTLPKDASAFGLVSLSNDIAMIRGNSATILALKGTFAEFEGLDRSDRFDAGVGLDTHHVLNGIDLDAGAQYLQDELTLDQIINQSAYASVGKETDFWEAKVKARISRLDYINEFAVDPAILPALKPLFAADQLNRVRSDVTARGLIGRNRAIGLYGSFTYADIDYPDLVGLHLRERNAEETSTLAGLRWTPSPFFQTDIGYRYNVRRFKAASTPDHEGGYLDFSATWIPTARFTAGIEIDRQFIDPSAPLAVVGDQITYAAFANYQLTGRWAVSARVAQRRTEDVGTTFEYRETDYELGTTYDATSNIQLYVNGFYRDFEEFASYVEQERFRIGAGVRWRLVRDKSGSLIGSRDLEDGPISVIGEDFRMSLGYSHIQLPETQKAVITDAFLTEATGYHTDHDGGIGGFKFDLAKDGLGTWDWGNGRFMRIDGKGFFAAYEGTQSTTCTFTQYTDCVFMNLKDDTPLGFSSNTNAFGDFAITTTKEARAWGAAVEAHFGHMLGGGMKDDAGVKAVSPFKMGLAVRGLKQQTSLHAEDVSVPDPVDYIERLDTYYYGAYIGFERSFDIRDLQVTVNAEAGYYGTESQYSGTYRSYFTTDGTTYFENEGFARLHDQGDAVIGTVRLDVAKNVGWAKIGAFAEGEYISSVPGIKHNNVDLDGGFPFDIAGDHPGTSMFSEDSINYTVGARLSIPLGAH
jgi:Putative beta-barrel porin 2